MPLITTSSTTTEYPDPPIEIDVGGLLRPVTFSANGEYLFGGCQEGVRVWRVEDRTHISTMAAEVVNCLAVSKDGRWIAAGTLEGDVLVWDAETKEQVFKHTDSHINGVDFSPDSTQLVSASLNKTASVWDIATQERVHTLHHDHWVTVAKYSPQGDRVATATYGSVQVWDSNDGRSLVDITVSVTPWCNTGLLWFNNYLFVLSDREIKQFEASTGSAVSEWPVPESEAFSCIVLPKHGEFIAYSTQRNVTFWDTATRIQLGLIPHPQGKCSIAVSPDDRFLAIGGEHGKITIKPLSLITDSIPLHRLHPTFQEPAIQIDDTALDPWKLNQLANAEASLSAAIHDSRSLSHHELASRALVRVRLQQWDAAIADATESIKIEPSVIGYIAKSVALVGNGEKHKAYRACDIAFERFHSTHVSFLLLVKAIIVFMAGEHDDAISRLDDLIDTVHFNSICHVVQAYMFLLLGNSRVERGDFNVAIQLFERAQAQTRYHTSQALSVVSLISGWKFDGLDITVRQRLCEALYASGRVKEAGESLLNIANTVDEDVYMTGPIFTWITDFLKRCLSTENSDDTTLPTSLLTEWAKLQLTGGSWNDALTAARGFTAPKFTIYRALCDHLEMLGQITAAAECFHQMKNELEEETNLYDEQPEWVPGFQQRLAMRLEYLGDTAVNAQQLREAISDYSSALSLDPAALPGLLIKRSRAYVSLSLWEDALNDANKVITLEPLSPWGYEMNQAALHGAGHHHDAMRTFRTMVLKISQSADPRIRDFKQRLSEKLECLGDAAVDDQQLDEAISEYSAALSLDTVPPSGLLIKRSKAYVALALWEDALNDANKVITLDPWSPLGYEMKHAILHGAGRHEDAIGTFETMLLKISQSPDPGIGKRRREYVHPEQTKAAIHASIENAIRESPLVLINTDSGRLLDKSGQACSFESQPIFWELISSMTTYIDHALIEQEVAEYYRYATLSHKWEENEPLFEKVIRIVVYDLEESLTHDKLRMFCKIVRDSGFHWAWSDTCCINKADHFVLQEALVSMFKWYEGSAATIVLLRGVHSPSKRGDLVKSIWNTRAWTLQEYHASKVVRFYTEDWKPYLNLDIPNHKESSEIILEMEEATGVSARALMALRPGLDDIREKLRLASTREATRVEDSAYSLLGIFSMSLGVVYGEGDKALGRFLAQLLTSSGGTNILAWTGRSGGFNSCLPAKIFVFNQLPTTHIPPVLERVEMDKITARLRSSLLNSTSIMRLYDRLRELPVPSFVGQRLKLPCIIFQLGPINRRRSGHVFRAQAPSLGTVEIRTEEDLSRFGSLYLVHPWIDFLLNCQPVGSVVETISEENTKDESSSIGELSSFVQVGASNITTAPQTRAAGLVARLGRPFGARSPPFRRDAVALLPPSDQSLPRVTSFAESLRPPSFLSPTEMQTLALQAIARLRQPFGALLFTPDLGNVSAFRRVAAETLITVQVEEITPTILDKLVNSVRTLDIL
ncbi:hypothetical protein OG21DRAFT_1511593 [Imleria badia]|nr:hypothetical protein OG21DRAFT_1511593 [Imleria badia]